MLDDLPVQWPDDIVEQDTSVCQRLKGWKLCDMDR